MGKQVFPFVQKKKSTASCAHSPYKRKECACAYYSLYWSSKLAWRRASSSGSSCSPLTQEGTHWLLKLHLWTTQTHMKTVTLTCALTKLLQGLSRVNNSCRQLTGIKLCLSMPVTQSSRLSYVQKFAFSMCCISLFSLLLHIFLTHSSTHSADRLTRKFHFLTDAHTSIHGSVSIVTRPHRHR